MADELNLNPDEAVILSADEIGYGSGPFGGGKNELILTNQALLLKVKGMFGKTKEVRRFPLSGIRVVNGEVQAKLGKKDIVTPSLDVYFDSGTERFFFTWEDDVKTWISHISSVITGAPVPQKGEFDDLFADMAKFSAVADSVTGSIKKVKGAFGIKSTEQIALHCPGCGASLSGTEGEVGKCPYCGSFVKFE